MNTFVQADDLVPVGRRPRPRPGVKRRSPPELCTGPNRRETNACSISRIAFRDLLSVPPRSILVVEPDYLACPPRCAPRGVTREEASSKQPRASGSGSSSSKQSPEPDRLGPKDRVASAIRHERRVAFVEDEIDHTQHRVEPVGQLRRRRNLYGMRASRIFDFARTMRCASVGAGVRNACAISSVVRPQTSRSVRATCASGASAGWQHVKISRSRSSSTSLRPPSGGIDDAEMACRRASSARNARGGAAVDGLESAGRYQPRARIGGHAVAGHCSSAARTHRAAPLRRRRSRPAGGSAWRAHAASRRRRRRPPSRECDRSLPRRAITTPRRPGAQVGAAAAARAGSVRTSVRSSPSTAPRSGPRASRTPPPRTSSRRASRRCPLPQGR